MVLPQSIDLHIHTTASDGTDTSVELLSKVRQSGIEWFSVTDHDTIQACQVIRDQLTAGDPLFINGVEFSCRDEAGEYHILGYGFDLHNEHLLRVIEDGHRYRLNKLSARLDYLHRQFGITFPDNDRAWLHSLNNPGKPHLAHLLVRYGYASDTNTAIRSYLDPLHLPDQYLHPVEAIEAILAAGGIPVLAHPSYGSGRQLITGEDMDKRLQYLTTHGLQGVEAFYSGFPPHLTAEILSFAEKYALYVTAGSDYHGSNKTVVLGDTHLPAVNDYPEELKRCLWQLKE